MEEQIQQLILFGLTRQEATIYLTLLQGNMMTGYEIAKETQISRSNVYSALSNLTKKGAVYPSLEEKTKYLAVSVEEFCQNHIQQLGEVKAKLGTTVKVNKEKVESYLTITGSKHIHNKISNILKGVKHRVYIGGTKVVLEQFQQEIKHLCDKGVRVVIITDQLLEIESLAEVYYNQREENRIDLIADSDEVLCGNVLENCLYSMNDQLVGVFKTMLKNEIEIITIKHKQ